MRTDAIPRPRAALVRAVSPRLADAELTHQDRVPIDVDRAVVQHSAYRKLLADLGLEVVEAPAAPGHPDGVFVEDALVVVGDLGILTRPGVPSRREEPGTLAPLLDDLGLRQAVIEAPGTLDGGDVLQVGHTVHVGRSSRTNDDAIRQLQQLVAPLGREVVPVDVTGALHLKTAVTALPDGTFLAVPGWVDTAALGAGEVLEAPEPTGADLLVVGDTVVLSAAAPRTAELVADRGWDVRTVAIDEFERAEAGPTCMCVLLP